MRGSQLFHDGGPYHMETSPLIFCNLPHKRVKYASDQIIVSILLIFEMTFDIPILIPISLSTSFVFTWQWMLFDIHKPKHSLKIYTIFWYFNNAILKSSHTEKYSDAIGIFPYSFICKRKFSVITELSKTRSVNYMQLHCNCYIIMKERGCLL